MADALTPLKRAERVLVARMIVLERRLPADAGESPLWPEYVQVVGALTSVRSQLYLAGK